MELQFPTRAVGPSSVDRDRVICWPPPSRCWCFKLQTPSAVLSSSPPAAAPHFCVGSKQLVPPQPMAVPPAHSISEDATALYQISLFISSFATVAEPVFPAPSRANVTAAVKGKDHGVGRRFCSSALDSHLCTPPNKACHKSSAEPAHTLP